MLNNMGLTLGLGELLALQTLAADEDAFAEELPLFFSSLRRSNSCFFLSTETVFSCEREAILVIPQCIAHARATQCTLYYSLELHQQILRQWTVMENIFEKIVKKKSERHVLLHDKED
jgi:hypothetical protein